MGFRCRWLATKSRDPDVVLGRLGFTIIEEIVEPVYDPGLYALEVDDWLVVIGDGYDHLSTIERAQAAQLSEGGEVVYFFTDDSSMVFELAVFRDGEPRWKITYDGRDGVTTPVFEGQVPFATRALLGRLEKEQARAGGPKAGVDHIYELAPIYAKELVGFRHDESLGCDDHLPIWKLSAKGGR